MSDAQGVYRTGCTSPSGSGREELSHLWSSGGLVLFLRTWYKGKIQRPGWRVSKAQEASRGQHRVQQGDTCASLGNLSLRQRSRRQPRGTPLSSFRTAPSRPVISCHSGAIRQTLDQPQQGSGPIHAKWVRGVNLRCLQRLRRFPSVSLSLSASDRLARAQLRKANNIQRCCSLYGRRSFLFPNPPLPYAFLSCSCVSCELLLLLLFLFPRRSISQVHGNALAPDVLRRTCPQFWGEKQKKDNFPGQVWVRTPVAH